jgi:hypothetical protein
VTTSGQVPNGGPRSLDEAIAYRNHHVIDRFVERYALPRAEAEDLFTETLRWLWLCARAERDPGAPDVFIDDCMALLDEMWHTFLLFTREYSDYCAANLGGYVHHAPTTAEDKQRVAAEVKSDPEGFTARKEARLRALYEYVYDQLGEETLVKWYSTYPEKYPLGTLKSLLIGFVPVSTDTHNPDRQHPTTEAVHDQEGAHREADQAEPPGQRSVLA